MKLMDPKKLIACLKKEEIHEYFAAVLKELGEETPLKEKNIPLKELWGKIPEEKKTPEKKPEKEAKPKPKPKEETKEKPEEED